MENKQISDITAFLMVFCALCLDGTQALVGWIPVVGNIAAEIFNVFILLVFFIWFKVNGVNLVTPKRLRVQIVGLCAELIPYLNLIPAWTGVVIYLIVSTRVKESLPVVTKTVKVMNKNPIEMATSETPPTFLDKNPRLQKTPDKEKLYSPVSNFKENTKKLVDTHKTLQ